MAVNYKRTVWKNRTVQKPRTYTEIINADGSRTDTPAPGNIIQPGVPLNEKNLNNMDKGIEDCAKAINELESAQSSITNQVRDMGTDIGNNARAITAIQKVDENQSQTIAQLVQGHNELVEDVSEIEKTITEGEVAIHHKAKNNPHHVDYFQTLYETFGGQADIPDIVGDYIGNGNTQITVNGYQRSGQYINIGFPPSKVTIFLVGAEITPGMTESQTVRLEEAVLMRRVKGAAIIAPRRNFYHSGCSSSMLTASPESLLGNGHGGAAVYQNGFVVQSCTNDSGYPNANDSGVRYLYFAWR